MNERGPRLVGRLCWVVLGLASACSSGDGAGSATGEAGPHGMAGGDARTSASDASLPAPMDATGDAPVATPIDTAGPIDAAGDAAVDAVSADGPPPAITAADFPAAIARAFCATLVPCCPDKGIAGCVGVVTTQMADALVAAAAAKNVFDGGSAAACVAAVQALGERRKCVPSFMAHERSLVPCYRVVDGVVPPGGECGSVAECKHDGLPGTLVDGFVGCGELGGVSPRRCRKFLPTVMPGEACEMGFEGSAAQVFVCTGGLTCQEKRCVLPAGQTQICLDRDCPTGSLCVGGSCQPVAAVGESCAVARCQLGHVCDGNTMKCTAPPPLPWILDVGRWATAYSCG